MTKSLSIQQNTITIARLRTEISLREAADSKLEASLRRRRLVRWQDLEEVTLRVGVC